MSEKIKNGAADIKKEGSEEVVAENADKKVSKCPFTGQVAKSDLVEVKREKGVCPFSGKKIGDAAIDQNENKD